MNYLLYYFVGRHDKKLSLDYMALRDIGFSVAPYVRLKVYESFREPPIRQIHWLIMIHGWAPPEGEANEHA